MDLGLLCMDKPFEHHSLLHCRKQAYSHKKKKRIAICLFKPLLKESFVYIVYVQPRPRAPFWESGNLHTCVPTCKLQVMNLFLLVPRCQRAFATELPEHEVHREEQLSTQAENITRKWKSNHTPTAFEFSQVCG